MSIMRRRDIVDLLRDPRVPFDAALIKEAADCIETLRDHLHAADLLLKPMAQLADVADHFDHDDEKTICSWRVAGERRFGPTMGECRAARNFVRARPPYSPHVLQPGEGE